MLRPSATSTGVSIGYNGDGTRVSETVAGITTQYLVDENNPTGYAQVVEELRGGTVQQRYSYSHDLISQTMVGAGATSFYSDVRRLRDRHRHERHWYAQRLSLYWRAAG